MSSHDGVQNVGWDSDLWRVILNIVERILQRREEIYRVGVSSFTPSSVGLPCFRLFAQRFLLLSWKIFQIEGHCPWGDG